jgi:hypothetical protein
MMVLGENMHHSFYSDEVSDFDINSALIGLALHTPLGIISDPCLYCLEGADDIAEALATAGPRDLNAQGFPP